MQLTPQMQRSVRGLIRTLRMILISMVVLLSITALLVVVQGRRDEVLPSGAAVVLGENETTLSPALQSQLDHALDLYRRRYARQIIVAAGTSEQTAGRKAAQEYLATSRLSGDVVLTTPGATALDGMNHVAALARANNISSVLVVGDEAHMLRSLKMARDLGLEAYGSPVRPLADRSWLSTALSVVSEAWAYIVYVFFRR